MLKVLFVGGIYQLEYSLYKELCNNPELPGRVCIGQYQKGLVFDNNYIRVKGRGDINEVKADFKPDITIFRSWVSTSDLLTDSDVLMVYEIFISDQNGNLMGGVNAYPKQAKHIAFQSKEWAAKHNQLWLPYCVSKHWEIKSPVKDIPVLLATNLPGSHTGGGLKTKSCDILAKPVVDIDPNLLHVYTAYGLEHISYLKPLIKGCLPAMDICNMIARSKIWLSPTTVWYDEGCLSHKLVQGLGCGTLTITNRHCGVENIFGKDGENIVYSDSYEETKEKVQYYLSHDKEREEVAQRGYEFVHQEFGWEKHLNRLHQDLKARI